MPRQINYHEPDAIDCYSMAQSLAADFGCLHDITTCFAGDKVTVLVRAYKPGPEGAKQIECQALVSRPVKLAKNLFVMQYSALLDCWHQLDRAVLAAATRPIEYGWDGRPRQPAARKR